MFLSKNHINVAEKLFPDPSLKNQNGTYPWINSLRFYAVCQVEGYRNILKLSIRPLPHVKFFYKTKRGLELVSLPHFLHDF